MAARIADLTSTRTTAKTANDAYEAAKAALASLRTTRDTEADGLRTMLAQVAKAAETESSGDGAQLQAAGYQLTSSAPTPAPALGPVLNLFLTMGDADGTLDCTCDPLAGAKTYEWELTTGDALAGPYSTVAQTTASKTTLTGLTSGARVWVRARAVGTKGPGPWSDPATKIVP